tara:strand:+ start:321 stop:464 length:144 start_codon:yes stop_codon:yes gene_type:complete
MSSYFSFIIRGSGRCAISGEEGAVVDGIRRLFLKQIFKKNEERKIRK